jgi:hypothetical protein
MILNNQDTRYNNQIITNNQIPITKQGKTLWFGDWLLKIGICLVMVSWLLVVCLPPGIAETKEAMALNFWQEFDIVFWQTLPFAGFWCYLIGSQLGSVNWNNVLAFSVLLSAGNAYHYAYRVSKPK